MKIVVTGAAGMIGSNLCSALLRAGHTVVGIDNFWRGTRENIAYTCGQDVGRLTIIEDDLSKPGAWSRAFDGADCVYHLADVVAGIGYVFSNQGSIFRQNLLINSNVSAVAASANVKRYIYVGTACSFPEHLQRGVDAPPLKEEDQFPASPESAYGWSKLMGELDAKYLGVEEGIPTVVLVFHNVYGTPCDYRSNRSQVLPALCYRALTAGTEPLIVWGNGSQGRAFVHVDDVVAALMASLTRGEDRGAIQIGPNICTSIREAVQVIVDLVDPNIEVQFDTTKPTGDLGRCADYTKARELLGWSPTKTLREGVAELLDFIRADMVIAS